VNRLPFLVLFVPDLRSDSDDWRVKLAAEVNEKLKASANPSKTFILCQPYHTDEADKIEGMEELSVLMGASEESEPKLFYMLTQFN